MVASVNDEPWWQYRALVAEKSADWGHIVASGTNKCWSRQCPDNDWIKAYSWKALQSKHTISSPYLCISSGCSSSLWLTFVVSGSTLLPTETVSGVSPPYKSSDNPLSPGTHKKKADVKLSHASIPLHLNDTSRLLQQAITYHDRTVCMLPRTLVMVSSGGWCHNSSMFRL